MSQEGIYLRRASGLTRKISVFDALVYAAAGPGPVFAFLYILWSPGLYPGADMRWASLTLVLLLPIMAVYYLFSVSMPRSGGEYVYVSRILHPSLGLFANWSLTIIGISWTGQLTSWLVTYGLGSLVYDAGVLNGDQGLMSFGAQLNNPSWVPGWLIGVVFIGLTYLILWWGAKPAMRVFWIGIAVSILGLLAILVASLMGTQASFISSLQQSAGVAYQSQIEEPAMAMGWTPGLFAAFATVMAGATYINLSLLGNTYTTNIAGEIKNVGKAQPLALFGSTAFFLLWWGSFTWAMWINPGGNFWNAISILVNAGQNPLPMVPVANQLVVYMTANPVLVHLANLGFIFGTFAAMVGLSLGPIRSIFAWSFDRVLPEAFSKVDKRGSPYVAVALATVLGFLFYAIYAFTTLLSFILFTITLWFVAWTVLGIAAIVFPYVKPDIFEKSPSVVKMRVAGIPVITICGVLATIVSIFTVYFTTVPAITGLTSLTNLASTVVILAALPFVLYYAARGYRQRKGINMALQYKSLPPD
jgi:amino acid transporter